MSVTDANSPVSADADLPRIGVVCGADINREIVRNDQYTNGVGNNDSMVVLKLLEPHLALSRMQLTPGYFRQKARRWTFDRCHLIWNVISDPDQNPKTVEVAEAVLRPLKQPIINPPKLLGRTTRVELPKRLAGVEGVRAPKVLLLRYPNAERVRRLVDEADFRFPAILRRTGTHNGEVVGVFDSVESLEAIFGDRTGEYYLIEFVDVRHNDGLYRKTRFFFVGDRVITRQHIVADDWLIHGRSSRGIMSEREDLLAEGRAMLIDGFEALPEPVQRAIHGIRERVGLDYAGLDCCIKQDGEVVVFECNATMGFRPVFSNPKTQHNRAALPRMLAAVRHLIETKTGRPLNGPD